MLDELDCSLRGLLTREIAALGYAPSNAKLATHLGISVQNLERALRRLHDAHALWLHPHVCRPRVVHPFALAAGGCWVDVGARGFWANCLYCGFGIAAALRRDATISTRLGGEAETVHYFVRDGRPVPTDDVFHLSTPVAQWWDNVVAACASFQPFRSADDVDAWCGRHDLPRGHTMPVTALWNFASDWYGSYLDDPWRKRTPEAVAALFARHGLTSPFWRLR
jgi:hypothetical protein